MRDEFTVSAGDHGRRLDKVVHALKPTLSRSFVQDLIESGQVRVDGQARKSNYTLRVGQVITVEVPAPAKAAAVAEEIQLSILYQDEALLVIDKPAGMVVHPAAGHAHGTLVNALLAYDPGIVTGNTERPGIVHRLDRDTSGVMLVARTDAALHDIQRQFASRAVHKTYLALVEGEIAVPQGRIEAPLARDPRDRKKIAVVTSPSARASATVFYVVGRAPHYTYLRLEPETGRTHQIRVHLAFLKHPVVGDAVYGHKKNDLGLERQFLHASRIEFVHPVSGAQLSFSAPLPADLIAALGRAHIDAPYLLA